MSKIRILHFSSHHEDCGIGKYQEMFLDQFEKYGDIENEFFETSPYQTRLMSSSELEETINALKEKLKKFDVLHIQHEFSFFSKDELSDLCNAAKELGKKLIITIHTSPAVVHKIPHLSGFGPHSIVHYLRAIRRERILHKQFTDPIKKADMILVHNQITQNYLVKMGIKQDIIKQIIIPVPKIDFKITNKLISNELRRKSEDVIFCTVGFLHKYKGVEAAIKSLVYLPSNYKLAIIGGLHPYSDNISIYDKLANLIRDLGVIDRVYITGYIKSDDELNSLIRDCDVCVYPYDRDYYANVSSASLNNAFANHMPLIAYPTGPFVELRDKTNLLNLCSTFSYYELARELKKLDIKKSTSESEQFAEKFSYEIVAKDLVDIYKHL